MDGDDREPREQLGAFSQIPGPAGIVGVRGQGSERGEFIPLSESDLTHLSEHQSERDFVGIILDWTDRPARDLCALNEAADQACRAAIPCVGVVATAEEVELATQVPFEAIVVRDGSPSEALHRAAELCRRLAGRSNSGANPREYPAPLSAHRELREENTRLRRRAEDDEVRAAMIVHDLRSPLSVVHGVVDELLLDLAGSDRELADMAARATRQLEGLVDRLEQLYAGAGEPSRPERVELGALAEGVGEGLRHAPAARGKQLVVRRTEPAHLEADRQDLVRVLGNLIGNALRHARSRVEVVVESGPHEVSLRIQDDGPGLPPAMRERLFVRASRTPGAGRMGLGLAIVQRAVERHHGRVEAFDRRERDGVAGACFVVHLPKHGTVDGVDSR